MTEKAIAHLRNVLLDRRREILDRVRGLEARWKELDLEDRSIELEEEAQKASITETLDRIDENGKDTIDLIDLALSKISLGDYGICESCGDDISEKRLEAIPWARLCLECARDFELKHKSLPRASEVIRSARLPDEAAGLTSDQIVRLIREQLDEDSRIDLNELHVSVNNGVISLEGTVPGEPEHQILLQILTDVLGFSAIVDRLNIDEVPWERRDRTPDTREEHTTAKDRLFYDQEDLSEDLFQARDDETPYSPPENPLPHQEEPGEERG